MAADVFEQPQPVAIRQAHIGEAQIVTMLLEKLLGVEASASGIHDHSHSGQCHGQQLTNVGFIVDN
jgi:hypothetical protein